ncbi:M28 family metallopeptidase [Arenibacter sp. GZD96]|uniref:M28 family metallopeptidase n=1 Tax=Aurantibrevibacter litoralis TaxID=3106030 RepID=UPI002AFE621D|nr:M28 family metallopeptidase [Arenibacter sp. GZD-96]MEA1785032.1 M28 family metallopeptidase [Arenibacter sp. GZD-96]
MKKVVLSIALASTLFTYAQQLDGFSSASYDKEKVLETLFMETVYPNAFKNHLIKLTEKPHVAGSKANEAVRDYMAHTMARAGWEVELYPYDVYMSKEPGTSAIEIVSPISKTLNQQEAVLEEDPFSSDPTLWKGWNAYSGSGDVTAQVVYANYGRKEDFEKLKKLGIRVAGNIVIARYGGNFRGHKAKFAEEYGAVGLIIYTDPKDSGYAKGLVYPEGAYFSETTIQRGSVLTEDFTGDPLTPFEPALPLDGKVNIKRLDPKDTKMHTIPVTPISYGAAQEIFAQMKGAAVPSDWQGGLPFTYRLDGGNALKVRLMVDQKRDFVRVNNVVGTLKGSDFPDEWIILGCHYDAWGFGATDPNSGTAMLLSLSETLGKLAKDGHKPKRSILIAHWDAEEHGVIGSAEWVEQMRDELNAKAVAYLNFDGGVAGTTFGAASSPTLKNLIMEAAKEVPYPNSEKSVFEVWKGEEHKEPKIGNLGGGSDHIAFYMHVGVPSLNAGTSGPSLYHSNYDSFAYYERFVDPSFTFGPAVAQLVGIMTLRLANADIIPYDVPRYATDLKLHFENVEKKVQAYDANFGGFSASKQAITQLTEQAKQLQDALEASLQNKLSKKRLKEINARLLALEKSFIDEKGMYFGKWYRSLYAASDPFSGYASWMLPGLEYEIALSASDRLKEWDTRYANAILDLGRKIDELKELLQK